MDQAKPPKPPSLGEAVGTIVIVGVLLVWGRAQILGQSLDMLWQVAMLAILLASGYAVFGQRAMQSAVEDAQEITDNDSDDSNDGTDESE
ncbi:hypothetical protein [Haloarcula pellucida]|nr:hypothetical protein [Halomicroarcula pellucida]MBX0350495.1 hypothetical protein [Halomicroarcula pellucida]